MPLRFLTAGESHGSTLDVIVEGLPAGVPVDRAQIDRDLRRRMGGWGRGSRMRIERDAVEILSGVRFGRTLGSPVALLVRNLDREPWAEAMRVDGPAPDPQAARAVTRPRPGHADLAGALKYGTHDARDILERASARETAARTAAGALARALLAEAGIRATSHTVAVGDAQAPPLGEAAFDALAELSAEVPFRTLDAEASSAMVEAVERAREAGDSIGGAFEVLVQGAPPGLGSHVHWDLRLDGRLAGALMSIPAVKAVSVGEGIESAARRGSQAHDPIHYDATARRFVRPTNRAGGIEGGMTNGEMIRLRGYLKPLATLPRPLASVDLVTKQPHEATLERTDTVPVVAAGVVGEAMACLVLADAFLTKFGGDHLADTLASLAGYRQRLARF
jgi:chorismate synthase